MMETIADRLKKARKDAGFRSAAEAANSLNVAYPTYAGHENGSRGVTTEALELYARRFKVTADWLLKGKEQQVRAAENDGEPVTPKAPTPNASFPPKYQEFPQGQSIPLLGQSAGGPNGRFVLNGTEVGRVFCPPMLEGVEGAYAVMVFGTSMEPRYFAGETVWVNPHLPVRSGDDVIAQFVGDEDGLPADSYIKRFTSQSSKVLRLYQYNPDEGEEHDLEFDADKVFSVHKIVFKANT